MKKQNGMPLLELETAYQSLRESGFDFSTAIGELIDNSVQAKANRIDIIPKIEEIENGGKQGAITAITQVVVVDNGDGMDAETLNKCPQLGFSTRYNDREGLGRFGVGATYASISQCIRTTFCSRPKGTDDFLATYVDLEKIANKTQIDIPIPSKDHLPVNLEGISFNDSNTIVIWNKCDRLKSDANGKPIKASKLLDELKSWVSRAYRHTIWDGVEICINCEIIPAYDPLYANTEKTEFPDDLSAIEWFSDTLDWPKPNSPDKTSPISVKLTLLPEAWRTKKGDGRNNFAKERRITENQGISVLRGQREVAFGNFYPMVPGQRTIDRFWGCEINFEPVLDECWEVKNVKRGARPTEELRNALRQLLSDPISQMRKKIQEFWRIGISRDIVDEVHETASSLLENNDSASAQEIKSLLSEMEISIEDISQILKELAVKNNWDWTTDGTRRKYLLSHKTLDALNSEKDDCFESIRRSLTNSDIDLEFKKVGLRDLEQAQIAYESRAFKACIVMLGAVLEGLMLGIIRKEETLKGFIADPMNAPKVLLELGLKQSPKPEELAEKISDKLTFEDFKNITVKLKPEVEKLKIEGIQNFRNSIHPWKSIKEPSVFDDPSRTRAMNYLTALSILAEKILV